MAMRTALGAFLAAIAAVTVATPVRAEGEGHEPLPRFEDPVCPGVSGLQVEIAELLVGRIRQNAQAIGRILAPPETCEPNLIVAFVDDSRAAIETLHRQHGYAFADMSGPERAEVLHEPGPVHVFSQVITRNRDGIAVSRRDGLVQPPHTTMWMAHSKIYRATQQNIVYVMVLIDAAAARGTSVNQLADYATLRAFVHRPPAPAAIGVPSILNLFAAPPAAKPTALTAFDHALLDSLYEGIPNINGTARAAKIAHATGREVAAD